MKIIAARHRSGRHAQIFRENRLTRRPWKFSFGLLEFYNRPFLLQHVFELCSYQAFIISCSSRRSLIEYLRQSMFNGSGKYLNTSGNLLLIYLRVTWIMRNVSRFHWQCTTRVSCDYPRSLNITNEGNRKLKISEETFWKEKAEDEKDKGSRIGKLATILL